MSFKKLFIAIFGLLASFVFFSSAQAQEFDTLSFIKAKLGEENIQVIDFGTPENQWGSLPLEWIDVLKSKDYKSLKDLIDKQDYAQQFDGPEGLNEMRYQKSILEAKKTQASTQAERGDLDEEIALLQGDIDALENDIKASLDAVVGEAGIGFTDSTQLVDSLITGYEYEIAAKNAELDQLQKELDALKAGHLSEKKQLRDDIKATKAEIEKIKNSIKEAQANKGNQKQSIAGVNLIFSEIDFYFSNAHWGGIPYSVARALRDEKSLWSGEARSLGILAENYIKLGEKEGLALLQGDLEGLIYLSPQGDELKLNSKDVDIIFQAMLSTQFDGERQVNQIIQSVVRAMRNILGGLAILWVVIAGVRMVLAQGDETVITEQKRSILYALLGLVIILLLEQLITILYGAPGEIQSSLRANREFDAEIYGIVSFIRAVIGIIAVAILVFSGIKAITAQGEEAEITKQRQAFGWVIAGLIVIAINKVIVENIFIAPVSQDDQIYSSNIANVIGILGNVLKFALGFVGIVALGILVWGAGMMVTNYGDEEQVTKAKTLIKNAVIGILVVIAAYTIVATLVSFG